MASKQANRSRHNRQQNATRRASPVVDALSRYPIILWARFKNVIDIRLRIAVVERKQARLHLNHELVSGEEDVIDIWQSKLVLLDLAGSQRSRRPGAMYVAASENLDAD